MSARLPIATSVQRDRPLLHLAPGPSQAQRRALVIGAAGGVGQAVRTLLARSEFGRRIAQALQEVLLLDPAANQDGVRPSNARWLPRGCVSNATELAELVKEHRVDHVIDLSSLGTLDCVETCDLLGLSYLTTSVEHWPYDRSKPWTEQIAAVLPGARPALSGGSFLIGSGMNPGIVNALVQRGIHALARAAGVNATARAVGLTSILITEEDTTFELDPPERADDSFAMTWSPRHCLEELFQPDALIVRNGLVTRLGHPPHAAWYRARCGDRIVDGMVVPHEEVITLSERYPDAEIAFVYRIAPAARRALAEHPERRSADAWPIRRLYAPHATALGGSDRVGVLLGTQRLGELWIGYDVSAEDAFRLGTGATQLQVAAGVLAGWAQLGRVRGIHFVEDLDWREYLSHVDSMLGPPDVVHDPAAHPVPIEARRRAERAVRPRSIAPAAEERAAPAS